MATFSPTGAGSWVVPANVFVLNVVGNAGGAGGAAYGGGGGGGCVYGVLKVTPGQTIYYNVAASAARSTNGSDTWVNLLTNAEPTTLAQGFFAKGGTYVTNHGAAAPGGGFGPTGATGYTGGNGYSGSVYHRGGGGGGAGSSGNGSNGTENSGGSGGAGGGGAGGATGADGSALGGGGGAGGSGAGVGAAGGLSITYFPESVTPSHGPTTGGTTVTLSGFYCVAGNTTVTFNSIAATDVNVTSPISLTCVTPEGTTGGAFVNVTTLGISTGDINGLFSYDYTNAPFISSVSPNLGHVAGGLPVTITGLNFTLDGSVTFGGVEASEFVFVSSSEITCVTPPNPSGSAVVMVMADGGTGTSSFTYLNPVGSMGMVF